MRNQAEKENIKHHVDRNIRSSSFSRLVFLVSVKDTNECERQKDIYVDWYHCSEIPVPGIFAKSLAQTHHNIHLEEIVAGNHPIRSSIHDSINPDTQKNYRKSHE